MAGREGDSLERSSLYRAKGLTGGFGKVHFRPYIRQEKKEVVKEDEEDERCSISVSSHGSFGRATGGLSWPNSVGLDSRRDWKQC